MSLGVAIIDKEYNIGDQVNTFFCGDVHLDAPAHNRALFIEEMEYAVDMDADIVMLGDLFDAIMHGDRKRYTPSSNKYNEDRDTAMNHMIEEAVELLTPYAKNIKVMLCGNHETSIIRFHNFDPLQLVIYELNKLDGVDIQYLGYQGYIRYRFRYANGRNLHTYDIKSHHGTGGGSEVTKGTITLNRMMSAYEADLHVMGHTHTKVILPDEQRCYLSQRGGVLTKSVKGVICGAYVYPASQRETKRANGSPRPYHVDYGDTKRTLQSTGGVMVSHTFKMSGHDYIHKVRVTA